MNIFLSTRRLTSLKEDHLTEFVATLLDRDSAFRQRYSSAILATYAARKGWDPPAIAEVATQRPFPGTGCCPDLLLTLQDDHLIVCEHKIEAPETAGTLAEVCGVPQLERYLLLPVDGVAYFRSCWSPPVPTVLSDPKYVAPASREHFLWSDLYPCLEAAGTDLAIDVRKAFETLGYTPPLGTIGDLVHSNPATRTRNAENFKKLWQGTRSAMRQRGWTVLSGSICELYLSSNPNSAAEDIYISPLKVGGQVLLFRATPRSGNTPTDLLERLRVAAETMHLLVDLKSLAVRRAGGPRTVVDVAVSLRNLLGDISLPNELDERLRSYVGSLVCAIDQHT